MVAMDNPGKWRNHQQVWILMSSPKTVNFQIPIMLWPTIFMYSPSESLRHILQVLRHIFIMYAGTSFISFLTSLLVKYSKSKVVDTAVKA